MLQPSSSFNGKQAPELFKWCSSFLRGYSVAHQGTEGLAGPGIEPGAEYLGMTEIRDILPLNLTMQVEI